MGQFGAGQGLRRLEDRRLLTGAGRYTDDVVLPGQAYGAVVRSPFAHARLGKIDSAEAKVAPGVLAVYTAAELAEDGVGDIPCLAPMKGKGGAPTKLPPHPVLARGEVHHVGDAVAFVVAETQAQAEEAAELVMVDYDDLPAVVDGPAALKDGAPQLHEEAPGNLALDWEQGDRAAVEAAFAKADHVARIELINNRVVVNAMEPRVCAAEYDAGAEKFTLHTASQGTFRMRPQLARQILGIAEEQLHIVSHDVGGGFGMKIFVYQEHALVLFAARRLGRPVRWCGSRSESFLTDSQGRDHVTAAEMAMDAQGRFLALKVETVANLGAYLSNFGPYIPTAASTPMLSGLYRIPAIYAEVICVLTNTVPVDAYRGAGRPEASYMMERLVDEAARSLGLDRREIRNRNFIRPEDLPYDTGLDRVYDSGDYPRLLREAAATIGWDDFETRRAEAAKQGRLLGIGSASYVEACGGIGSETAELSLDGTGGVELVIGTMTNGQGHLTAYAQLLNDKLGLDPEKLTLRQGDSEVSLKGGGTGGSRSLLMGGVAINRASDKVIETAKKVASHLLEAALEDIAFDDGVFSIVGTDRRVTLAEVGKAALEGDTPDGEARAIRETADYDAEAMTYPNGCHACEVEVDAETGRVKILRYVVVDDFGTVVNPLLVGGQVHGGIAQGIGQALLENTVYDETGQLLTASYMDYCLPRADDLPEIELTLVEDMPCTTNPMGVKGAGEAGCIGAPPAVMNALRDALEPLGVTRIDMPATPERVWRAIQAARAGRQKAAE
ncbi:MAG: xanthine dehydrogenase family protein molybdopterin-binding subunit [Rhodovibrionaceae bacterium]